MPSLLDHRSRRRLHRRPPAIGRSSAGRGTLLAVTTTSLLPDGFLFGVATAGFQIEGGFNGPGEPTNNWAAWEREGRIERSGAANSFWINHQEQIELAASVGLSSFRLSVEWSRVEPTPGNIDAEALAGYGRILAAIEAAGMEPVVTLQHFTHPQWLGDQPWRDPSNASRLVGWMERAVAALGEHCSNWVTINEPNILSVNSFFTGIFPPGHMLDGAGLFTSFDTLLAAHVAAYDVIHGLQPDAVVTTNPYTFSIYELDQVATDLLTARSRGVADSDIGSDLLERRREHYRRIGDGGSGATGTIERFLRRFAASQAPVADALPVTRSALAASDAPRHLDVIAVDHYAPLAASHLWIPGAATAGGRWWKPGRALWDDAPDPAFFVTVLEEAAQYGRPVWVLENGMCQRTLRGRAHPRLDGVRRPAYLAEHIGAVVAAVESGIDIGGFWHWTLIDNYEWGSYEPRFGLFGLDRERDNTIKTTDDFGDDSAGALRSIIEGLRGGDDTVIERPARR